MHFPPLPPPLCTGLRGPEEQALLAELAGFIRPLNPHLPPLLCTGLRGPEEQALLAELAGCPGVHLAASVDHINAPLLWDVKTRASFRYGAREGGLCTHACSHGS